MTVRLRVSPIDDNDLHNQAAGAERASLDHRPGLLVSPLGRAEAQRAWGLLPPHAGLYRVGTETVALVRAPSGGLVARPLTVHTFRAYLDQHMSCYRENRRGERVGSFPPPDLAQMMLNDPASPLPELAGIIHAPRMRADGSIRTTPGYDPTDRLYLDCDFVLPPVSESPTDAEVAAARDTLLDPFADFPFESEADRTAALALTLLPFARDLIDGPTPMTLVDSPTPGSGKGLVVAVALAPGLGPGGWLSLTVPEGEDEMRKVLTTMLVEGRAAICFDNLNRFLRSGVLASLLTALEWSDRRLGGNVGITVLVRLLLVLTGNNVQLDSELVRRSVPIRLTPSVERPEDRTGFRHPDLLAYVRRERPALAHACLTLCRRYHVAGRPEPSGEVPPFGSFEAYRRVVGGILDVGGFPDFLKNRATLREFGDPDAEAWGGFVTAWAAEYGIGFVPVADLLPLAEAAELRLHGDSDAKRRSSLGTLLGHRRQRVIGGYRMEKGSGRARRSWGLVRVGDTRVNCDTPIHLRQNLNLCGIGGEAEEAAGRNGVTGDTGDTLSLLPDF